ncbi:MAG: 5'-3' exonuclease H3TH domain-containing protein, partial [Saprospiraceae bacterium]|nr:5'-3' exonuclease H3TH domain-containing protein [Saprospiraceae bacterium]
MRTLIVDGTNLLVRAVHAAERMPKKLSVIIDGHFYSTGPVYLFINSLSSYVRQVEPDRMMVCWDGGRSKHRLGIDPDYKADRPEREDDVQEQLSFRLAKEFLDLNGIAWSEESGVEADDLVAAYVRSAGQFLETSDDKIVILSGDKDFLQLVGRYVYQIRPGVKPEIWDEDVVRDKMGCSPKFIPYLMALTGDKGDGVPGVKGIGPKTALKLLKKHEWSFDNVLTDPKLEGKQADARRSYALVDLRTPIYGDLEDKNIPMFNNDPFEHYHY